MIKVLIIEDEQLAADRLIRMLGELDKGIEIIDHLDSVKTAIDWFSQNDEPQLLFLDIQLSDGLSFEILEQTEIKCPIIFTTAYDQYAIQAFKSNSIDYLLKPVAMEDLERAWTKFINQGKFPSFDPSLLAELLQPKKKYKERFVIKLGEHLKSVSTEDISLFFSENKATYVFTHEEKKFLMDHSLSEVEALLDPEQFFRINRAVIVARGAMEDIIAYSNSRLKVVLKSSPTSELVVARDRVSDFKQWLE